MTEAKQQQEKLEEKPPLKNAKSSDNQWGRKMSDLRNGYFAPKYPLVFVTYELSW